MKLYRDKDTYIYNESLYDKSKKREDRYKRIISALMACQIFCSVFAIKTSASYSVVQTNPFDGNNISSSDFITNYKAGKSKAFLDDKELNDMIETIKNSSIDEKKAYLLYYAILSNHNLTHEDKVILKGFINYFIDNKYIDYQYLYNKLATLKIDKINSELGAAGTYNLLKNKLSFDSKEARKKALTHETLHSEEKDSIYLSYEDYAWFIEGLTSVLNYEYFDAYDDGYDYKADFIRILCLLVGPDVLFKVRATGDIDALVNEFINKGIEKEKVQKMFYLINKMNFTSNTAPEVLDIELELRKILLESYNVIYNNPKFVNPLFYIYYDNVFNNYYFKDPPSENEIKNIYFFNSQKKKEYPVLNTIYKHNEQETVIFEYYEDYYNMNIYINNKFYNSKNIRIETKALEDELNMLNKQHQEIEEISNSKLK